MSYFPQTAITDTSGNAIAVGQTTKSASLPVTIASDQPSLSVSLPGVTSSAPLAIYDGYLAPSVVNWTSATAVNTAITSTTQGMDTVIVSFVPSGTITAGVITFEVYDGANWLPVKAARIESYSTDGTYTLTGTTRGWQLPVSGFPQFRTRLSTAITGTGTAVVTHIVSSAPDTSVVTVGIDPATTPSVSVSNFPGTQPVSGTVTSNQGTANATPWNENIAQVGGAAITLGQKVAASSFPITLASDNGISQAAVSPGTTTAPSATIVVAGKSNDSTAKYAVIPLGPSGQSVLTQPVMSNLISGTATTTVTTDTSVIAAQGAGVKVYMTGFSVYNSGSTAAVITFKNGSGGSTMWTTFVPAGGVSNLDLSSPIATAANTGVFFAASASSTTVGVAVCGFSGP